MKEPSINKRSLRVVFDFFFIGGGAALLGLYRAVTDAEPSLGYLMEESDGETFVCGAHA